MAKVFISHSWHDNDIAKKIADNLKRDGAEIWIDYATIKSGAIPVRISQALEWCDTMVLIWSKASAESYYVGLEWQSALDLQKAIIPCIIDDTKRPAILRGFLFIDLRDFDRGYEQLFQALELKREKTAEKPSKPVEKVGKKTEPEKPKKPEIKTVKEPVHRERIQKKEKQAEIEPLEEPDRIANVQEKQKIIKDMTLIFIKGGTFEMGDTFDDGDEDEKPVHKVTISDFYMSKTAVTNDQFCKFLNEKGNQEEGGATWLDIEDENCKIVEEGGRFISNSRKMTYNSQILL